MGFGDMKLSISSDDVSSVKIWSIIFFFFNFGGSRQILLRFSVVYCSTDQKSLFGMEVIIKWHKSWIQNEKKKFVCICIVCICLSVFILSFCISAFHLPCSSSWHNCEAHLLCRRFVQFILARVLQWTKSNFIVLNALCMSWFCTL